MFSGRQADKVFPMQGEKKFAASHIFGPAVRLEPVPVLAEDFWDLGAAFVPVDADSILNNLEIGLGDGSFSYGNGQHPHCIAKQNRGRQQKTCPVK